MRLTPANLDRIEALAQKVKERVEYVWANDRSTEELDDAKEQIENLLVYNPDTVLALVEAARRGMMASAVIAYCPPEPEPADDDD